MEMLAAATAAGVGGFVATSVLYPLDTLKTRMQSGAKVDSADDDGGKKDKSNPGDHFAAVKSLYRGIQYKTAESSVSKFLYFYAYTMLAQVVAPKDGKPIGTATNLLIGYLSEFAHLPLTLPMEVIATRLQTSAGGGGGVLQIVKSVLEESGARGFYKGFQAYFVLCLQPAIQYTVFERAKELYLRRFKQASKSLGALEVRKSCTACALVWQLHNISLYLHFCLLVLRITGFRARGARPLRGDAAAVPVHPSEGDRAVEEEAKGRERRSR